MTPAISVAGLSRRRRPARRRPLLLAGGHATIRRVTV
jgi:hypothetical protein